MTGDGTTPFAPGRRLFASLLPPEGGEVRLDPAASSHARVLRLKAGDAVCLFDGQGREAHGNIVNASSDDIVCRVEEPKRVDVSRGRVMLIQCVPKGTKLDGIVRMTTELGVHEIHLADSERSVPRPPQDRSSARLERLGRVVREAARQSGLDTLPIIHAPVPLEEAIARAQTDPSSPERWVLTPLGTPIAREATSSTLWLVVGPEGGFSDRETTRIVDAGFEAVRLAATTLRVETAAPVAVGIALDRLARLGRGH